MFGFHPTQVGAWKKQALAGLPDIFGNGREQMRQQSDTEKDELFKQIGQLYMKRPFYGSRKMVVELEVNRKRIQRLMRILGIEAHYPKPNLSRPALGHQIYPYLLRGVAIEKPNHVWSTDITYLPMRGGFLYLVAVMDWFSRFVLSWELSNSMETGRSPLQIRSRRPARAPLGLPSFPWASPRTRARREPQPSRSPASQSHSRKPRQRQRVQ